MDRFKKATLSIATIMAAAWALSGCAAKKSDSSSDAAGLTISGALSTSSSASKPSRKVGVQAVAVTDLELYGLAFSSPPEVQTVALGSDGSFSLSFSANAANSSITLVFRNKTDPTQEVGTVKFQDTSSTGLDGAAKEQGSISLTSSVSLGNLSINEEGEVVVPMSQVQSVVAAAPTSGTLFDFTGTWQFAAFDGTLPSGYQDACPAQVQGQEKDNNCNGPSLGENVWLKRMDGKAVDSNNTTTSTDKFGIAVWQSEAAFQGCGSKLGFTYAEGISKAKVDFTNSGIAEGEFTWASGWADGWKSTSARSQFDAQNCESVANPLGDGKPGWKCYDSSNNYHIGTGGGCYLTSDTAKANPVHVRWENVNSNGTCTDVSSGLPTGWRSNSCAYTGIDHDGDSSTAAVDITCTHTSGEFDSSNNPINNFDFNNVQKLYNGPTDHTANNGDGDGALCSSLSPSNDRQTLAQLRCYMEYYHRKGRETNACLKDVRGDWEATDPANFLRDQNGPQTASGQHVLALFEYNPDGQSGSFSDSSVHSRGIQSGNSWISCKINEDFRMTVKRLSDTQMRAEFVTASRLLDTDKPECVAGATELGLGISKHLMLLNKQ